MNTWQRSLFNWVGRVIVPLASSVMEAQPITLVLLVGSLLVTGHDNAVPLGEMSIVLLLLGLHWWAMGISKVLRHGPAEKMSGLFLFLGLCIAGALVLGTHPALFTNTGGLIAMVALITWCWVRGTRRAEEESRSEDIVMTSFKGSFAVLVVILLLAATNFASLQSHLLGSLAYALPTFFLSSLVVLSCAHFSQVHAGGEQQIGSAQADATSWWSMLTVLLWLAIVGVMMALGAFVFPPLLAALQPLWEAVEGPVVQALDWLGSLLQQQPPPRGRKPPIPLRRPPVQVPYHNQYVVIILAILVTVLFLMLIAVVLREWYLYRHNADEESMWRRISWRSLLQARPRKKRVPRAAFQLEALDPSSVRAHYRSFLLAMARRENHLAWRSEETPTEYQARLLSSMSKLPEEEEQRADAPPVSALLEELTSAYTQERYGGKSIEPNRRAALHRWVPYLVRRLKKEAAGGSSGPFRQRFRKLMNREIEEVF